VAEWLRSGLQNRLLRFNSGRGLQHNLLILKQNPRPQSVPPILPATGAELAKHRQAVRAQHEAVLAEKREVAGQLERVNAVAGEMRQLDEIMRRAIMRYAGMLTGLQVLTNACRTCRTCCDRQIRGRKDDRRAFHGNSRR
jgi:hypothetical protein